MRSLSPHPFAAIALALPLLLAAAPAGASDPTSHDHAETTTTSETPAASPDTPAPPADEQRQRARDVGLPDDGPAPASRDAIDRARRNAESGIPAIRDRGLGALSNEDLNQVLIGPRGQKVIIREYDTGGQSSRSITVMDSDVTSTRGQGSQACSSVGSIGDNPGCQ